MSREFEKKKGGSWVAKTISIYLLHKFVVYNLFWKKKKEKSGKLDQISDQKEVPPSTHKLRNI